MTTGVTPLSVDVTDVIGLDRPVVLDGWVSAPAPSRSPSALVYCLAGGRSTTAYFDTRVEGLTGYSMAEHFADDDVITVALDHPGIGSSTPIDDLCALTPTLVARVHAYAVDQIIERLGAGTLTAASPPIMSIPIVGLGHSMGGALIDVQQARHQSFDALVGLGHGSDGLPAALNDDELSLANQPLAHIEAQIVALARRRVAEPKRPRPRLAPGSIYFTPDVPEPVRKATASTTTRLLETCGLMAMIPGSCDAEKAAITVPVFLGFGDHDLVPGTSADVGRYRSSSEVTLYHLENASHLHNQATTRFDLWDRILAWLPRTQPRS